MSANTPGGYLGLNASTRLDQIGQGTVIPSPNEVTGAITTNTPVFGGVIGKGSALQQTPPSQAAVSPRPPEFENHEREWFLGNRLSEELNPIGAAIDDFHDRGSDIAGANYRGKVDLWRAATGNKEVRYNATPEQMTPLPEARRILDMGFEEYAKTLSDEDRFAFDRFTYGADERRVEQHYAPSLNDWVKFHAWRQSQQAPAPQQAPTLPQAASPPTGVDVNTAVGTPPDQMGSPSPDARRYDGLNYKSNNVVSASRAVGETRGRMGGSAVGRKQSEAISQMTRMANGMAEGRGGQQYRDAVAAFEAAIASGDEAAISAAQANLSTLLSPMLDKFDARFKAEVGDIGIDIRQQFLDTLRARIQSGSAGTMRGMPQSQYPTTPGLEGVEYGPYRIPGGASSPQSQGVPGAPQVRQPQAPSRPQPPKIGPGGIRSHQYGSMGEAVQGINASGQMRSGDLVTIAGSNYTSVPTFDANGNPEWGLAPAFVFGGTGDTPTMAVPDPFSFPDANAWGDSLSDLQRQTMLDSMLTDPAMRSSLERGTLEKIDSVRRSRQGLMRNSMSARDREASVRTLRLEENAALYAAMASVGARGQGRALSMSQYMEGERQAELSRKLEEEAARRQIELDAAEINRVRNAEIKEEQDRVAAERARQAKIEEAVIADQKAQADRRQTEYAATVARRRDMVPHTREAVRSFADANSGKAPIDDPTVKRIWESLSPDQRDQYERWSSLLAETAPEFDELLRGGDGNFVQEKDESNLPIKDENGNPIYVKRQVPLNPNAFLPRNDLVRVLQALKRYEPPPDLEPEQTLMTEDAVDGSPSEVVPDKVAIEKNRMMLEWWQGNNSKMVGEIITAVAKHAPGIEREMLADMGINRTTATSIISEWQANVLDPASASGDPARIRAALIDAHGLATVAAATGAATDLNRLSPQLYADAEAFADAAMRGELPPQK